MSILIISESESDLSRVMCAAAECKLVSFREAESEELSDYSAIAILCGTTSGRPVTMKAALRMKIDEFAESGKPIFYEWCSSFAWIYTVGGDYNDGRDTTGDAMSRYVYIGETSDSLCCGDLLDSQANDGCIYNHTPKGAVPILYNGGHIIKHDHVDPSEIKTDEISTKDWRLWYYDKTQLVSSFKLCNFIRARFAPFASWCGIIEIILKHLGIERMPEITPCYTLGSGGDTMNTFARGLDWFEGCGLLLDNGHNGIEEGMSHGIHPNGVQDRRRNVRCDCVGEAAGAYLFDYLLRESERSLEIYKNLSSFLFERMQVKNGRFRGAIRWSEGAWETVYGDDVARAVISTLFYIMYTGDTKRLPEIEDALDFLVSITGSDGLMNHGNHFSHLTPERIAEITSNPTNQYCAHRNAYYSAALLLAYRLNHKQIYLDTAVKGLSSIMAVYPNTMRAISETEELCRLIFPLSCLYQATGSEEHKKWLYTVSERLESYRYKNGGYTEVDPGYTAYRSRTKGDESSMLADNGNEIAELLYSLNWLPLGFSYAWYVTGDEIFRQKWEDIARFMASAQIVSENKEIDGAWSRCLDLSRMEIYGMPHDVGWGPCCIESGWTVAEILMGLGFGMTLKKGILPTGFERGSV